MKPAFHADFVKLFHENFHRLYRFLARSSGDPDLAADLAQEAFVRLYQRGFAPDRPEAWLITVGLNLFRNARSTERRRLRLVDRRGEETLAQATPSPADATESKETRHRVQATLDRMPERERQMLLLRAEGFSYRDIATALGLNEASVGTLMARARREFRTLYEETSDAPR